MLQIYQKDKVIPNLHAWAQKQRFRKAKTARTGKETGKSTTSRILQHTSFSNWPNKEANKYSNGVEDLNVMISKIDLMVICRTSYATTSRIYISPST